jgi:glycosyltransferase involved in cell wall biosynthesis
MRIGIDASRYGHPEATGIEWYSYHLLNDLIPLFGRDHRDEVYLYAPKDFQAKVDLPFNVKKRIIPFRRFWTTLRLSFEMLARPVDILFVPSHFPLITPKKSIITIHDVAFKYHPKSYSFWNAWLSHRSVKKAVRKAYRIIVPSEATKRDLIKFYRCPEEKIVVIPHGAPEVQPLIHFSPAEKQKRRQQFFLGENDLFALYIGRLETKKNLIRLIEAFKRFLIEFPDWKLILAGKRGNNFDEIWKTVKGLGLEHNVIAPGYVTEEEKAFLLIHCRILAFPSLHEGFGLPILEGFAYHRPVLTSNTSSMPEVAGNAAYLINPEKVEEISVGLKRLAGDGMLTSSLIQKGEQQLRKFNWEKTAQQTYEVLVTL